MAKYIVNVASLVVKGKQYLKGETVELSDAEFTKNERHVLPPNSQSKPKETK